MAQSSGGGNVGVLIRSKLTDVYGPFDDIAEHIHRHKSELGARYGIEKSTVLPQPLRGFVPYTNSPRQTPSNSDYTGLTSLNGMTPGTAACIQNMRNVPPLVTPLQSMKKENGIGPATNGIATAKQESNGLEASSSRATNGPVEENGGEYRKKAKKRKRDRDDSEERLPKRREETTMSSLFEDEDTRPPRGKSPPPPKGKEREEAKGRERKSNSHNSSFNSTSSSSGRSSLSGGGGGESGFDVGRILHSMKQVAPLIGTMDDTMQRIREKEKEAEEAREREKREEKERAERKRREVEEEEERKRKEEQQKKEEEERLRKEKEEEERRARKERKRKEKEERRRKEEEEEAAKKRKEEEENKRKKEAAERLRKEEEDRKKKEEEELKRLEEEKKREEEERLKKEKARDDERRKKEAEEKRRLKEKEDEETKRREKEKERAGREKDKEKKLNGSIPHPTSQEPRSHLELDWLSTPALSTLNKTMREKLAKKKEEEERERKRAKEERRREREARAMKEEKKEIKEEKRSREDRDEARERKEFTMEKEPKREIMEEATSMTNLFDSPSTSAGPPKKPKEERDKKKEERPGSENKNRPPTTAEVDRKKMERKEQKERDRKESEKKERDERERAKDKERRKEREKEKEKNSRLGLPPGAPGATIPSGSARSSPAGGKGPSSRVSTPIPLLSSRINDAPPSPVPAPSAPPPAVEQRPPPQQPLCVLAPISVTNQVAGAANVPGPSSGGPSSGGGGGGLANAWVASAASALPDLPPFRNCPVTCLVATVAPTSVAPVNIVPTDQSPSEYFNDMAKSAKYRADREKDWVFRVLNYVESVTYFCLSVADIDVGISSDANLRRQYTILADTYDMCKAAMTMITDSANKYPFPNHFYTRVKGLCLRIMSCIYYRMYLGRQKGVIHIQREIQQAEEKSSDSSRPPSGQGGTPGKIGHTPSPSTSSPSMISIPSNVVTLQKSYMKTMDLIHSAHVHWQESHRIMQVPDTVFYNRIQALLSGVAHNPHLHMDSPLDTMATFVMAAVNWMKREYEAEKGLLPAGTSVQTSQSSTPASISTPSSAISLSSNLSTSSSVRFR